MSKIPFLAFANDTKDIETLKQFAIARSWSETSIRQGDIKTATDFLKDNAPPAVLLVEIPSASEAQALLDGLAEVCSPDTKVIVIGSVNEYSFYCWLLDIGISSYLLKPLTSQAIENAYAKSQAQTGASTGPIKTPGKVIAVLGTRGGVGCTTIAINLAGIIADSGKKNTALVDLDPQKGSIALALDIEPSKGFREALERPDRMDALFLERAMHKHSQYLSILDSEETLHDRFAIHESAGDILLKQLKDHYQVIILDMPRHLNNYTRQCLGHVDKAVVVTELSLVGLRDTLRICDMLRQNYNIADPIVIANRVGATPKYAVKPSDFEKGINDKVAFSVPFQPDFFMPISTDIPVIKSKSHAGAKPMYALAGQLIPETKMIAGTAAKEKKGTGLFKRAPKEAKE
jgi:pilus assembly protein CpaE